jgi:hypothetical protein
MENSADPTTLIDLRLIKKYIFRTDCYVNDANLNWRKIEQNYLEIDFITH